MKIYFTAAVSNVSDEVRDNYNKIVSFLEELGHTTSAKHLEGKDAGVIRAQGEKEAKAIQKKMATWKKQSDLVIVEASTPSFGVGQEIAEALSENKQVIVLYMSGMKPHVLTSHGEDSMYLVEYSDKNLKSLLGEYIEYAKSRCDTRFNFFISPQIGTYLDWIAKNRRVPRAVYLRRLIENDMKENKEYNEQ